jgi:hypothetical protein
MSALDQAAKLKAARRAELAAAEEERQRQEEAARRASNEALSAAVRSLLERSELAWLEPLVSEVNFQSDTLATISFQVPGHRAIYTSFSRTGVDPFAWAHLPSVNSRAFNWTAVDSRGNHPQCQDISDALIAAEIEGWTPPKSPVNKELLEAEVAKIWPAMFAHGMPADVALELLEEKTEEDAEVNADALLIHAVAWMANTRPTDEQMGAFTHADAGMIGGEVLMRNFDNAEARRKHLANRLCERELTDPAFAGPWLEWCGQMRHAIALCRAVAAEASAQGEPK